MHLVVLFAVSATAAAAAETTSVFPDPGLTEPRFRFGTGGVWKGRPSLFDSVPDMPGPVSAWRVLQWRKSSLLRPDAMIRRDATADPLLGSPAYTFRTRGSSLGVFRHGASYVYELAGTGGVIDAAGGSNLFLSAPAVDKAQTFDRAMTYSIRVRLSRAEIGASKQSALRDGRVLAQVFSGFSIRFADPDTGAAASVFLQLRLADSRGAQPTYRGCTIRDGRREIV